MQAMMRCRIVSGERKEDAKIEHPRKKESERERESFSANLEPFPSRVNYTSLSGCALRSGINSGSTMEPFLFFFFYKAELRSYLREVQIRALGGALLLEAGRNGAFLQVFRQERDDPRPRQQQHPQQGA